MMRWTRLAIAVVIGACAKGERDQQSQSAAKATTAADSAMAADTRPVDTSPAAVAADSAAPKATSGATTQTKPARTDTAKTVRAPAGAKTNAPNTTGPTGAEAMTGVRTAPPPDHLSVDQVKRLQAALNKVGCHAGPPDGVEGTGTQHAIACGLKKYKLASSDLSGLYRRLGLEF